MDWPDNTSADEVAQMFDERAANKRVVEASVVQPPAKKPRPNANTCTECSAPKKYDVKGHSKAGWCPTKQCYAPGAAAKQLRNWEQLTDGSPAAELDELASAFVVAVQCGDYLEVKALLAGEGAYAGGEGARRVKALGEHLVLLRVQRRLWSWSVLQEAASKLKPSDDENANAVRTFGALVDHCVTHQIDVNALPKKTDSRASVAHQVAYRGNKVAMEKLIEAGEGRGLFDQTRSGWLPLHNALNTRAPAYTTALGTDAPACSADPPFALWLLGKMRTCGDVSGLTMLPEGFTTKHGVDLEAFQRLLDTLTPE